MNFDALQTAIDRAQNLNYLTATIAVRELMRQDETGWTSQGQIDSWTQRLNDLPDNSDESP